MLPVNYSSYDSYFKELLRYLRDYSWVYSVQVTHVLVNDVLSQVPSGWLLALLQLTNDELNRFPYGLVKDNWPESLVEFCCRSQALRLTLGDGPAGLDPSRLPCELRLKLSQKKQHEVCRLASLVHRECRARGITRVLDIGAGLGYLGRVLHQQYGLQVLGVEVDGQKVDAASRRQLSSCPSNTSVSYVCGEVMSDSEQLIRRSIHTVLGRPHADCSCGQKMDVASGDLVEGWHVVDVARERQEGDKTLSSTDLAVCVVGLHTCGDLAVSALNLFAAVPELRCLVLLPCCHHKMSLDGDRCFPLSRRLKAAVKVAGLLQPGLLLRLASQETAARWRGLTEEEHRQHSFHVLSRAVMQLHAHQAKLELVKKKRRGVRRAKLKSTSFADFLDDALERYEHVGAGGGDKAALRSQLERLWVTYEGQGRAVELLTALQVAMQGPAEHLVTLDRLAYLQEISPAVEAFVVKALDECVSPRCLALVAHKPAPS